MYVSEILFVFFQKKKGDVAARTNRLLLFTFLFVYQIVIYPLLEMDWKLFDHGFYFYVLYHVF